MVVEEGLKRGLERRGLIAVLKRQYWREYGHNPFLRASSGAATWLMLKGAANDDAGDIDIFRVRSIRPDMRNDVMNALLQYQGMRETFVHILLTLKNECNVSTFCTLRGHESTIIPLVATFACSTGWSRMKLEEAKEVLQDAIDRFSEDVVIDDDLTHFA